MDAGPLPAQTGADGIAGIDLDRPRIRAAPSAALALAPPGRRVHRCRFTAKVGHLIWRDDYAARQASRP